MVLKDYSPLSKNKKQTNKKPVGVNFSMQTKVFVNTVIIINLETYLESGQ